MFAKKSLDIAASWTVLSLAEYGHLYSTNPSVLLNSSVAKLSGLHASQPCVASITKPA